MKIHRLKILPKYFKEVENGNKTFEIRKNDRGFKVGEILQLLEYDGKEYTGKVCTREITYILANAPKYGLKKGYVILAIQKH